MNDSDYQIFSEVWTNAHEIMPGGKVLTPGAMTMCFDTLNRFPLDVVLMAINRHVATGRFAPTPKDIIDLLCGENNHIGADEAWAIVVESMDERATVAMTREIAEARGIALSVWEAGDDIGARMAFREAYNRIVKTTAKQPEWYLSLGHDPVVRANAAKKAVQLGRLTSGQVKTALLTGPMDGGYVGKLLTGKVSEISNNKDLQQRWGSLKQALLEGQSRLAEKERQANIDTEKKRLAFEENRKKATELIAKKTTEV